MSASVAGHVKLYGDAGLLAFHVFGNGSDSQKVFTSAASTIQAALKNGVSDADFNRAKYDLCLF